jgi:hypothetical protein
VLYLATASGPLVRDAMRSDLLGQMVTPDSGNRLTPGATWALDNGCFNARWTPGRWLAALDRHAGTPGCLFAVVPDVVADSAATDALWCRWWHAPAVRGYRTAYVAQDGCDAIPPGADALFIGGSTEWKLGSEAAGLARYAKQLGLWVHMGRVNSLRRLRLAALIGCDSVDGTYLAFGPDRNLPTLLRWLHPAQPSMFGGVA